MSASRHKLPVTILAQGYRDSPTSIVQLKSQYRTVKDLASETPHQFRARNNLIEMQRTGTNSHETAEKTTKLINILPLIAVWLQVRVLPGPPAFAGFASYGSASHLVAKAAPPKPTVEVKRVRRSSNEVRAETDRHPAEPPHPGSIVSWPLIH
jgi:hypothetical protein